MANEKIASNNLASSTNEDARVGYQVAVNLWTTMGEEGLAIFNAMLVVNSILIAVIGLTITSQERLTVFELLLPILGLLLCSIWFTLGRREAQYSDYYILCARELEEKYLSDSVKTVSRGGLFAEGQKVILEIDGKPLEVRMGKLARIFRAKNIGNWVIIILVSLYIAAIVQGLL